jgi:PAS domain S-box-containing protein
MNHKNKKPAPDFSELINNLPILFLKLDSQLKLSYVSENVLQITGYRPEELMGLSVGDLLHPDDQPDALKGLRVLVEENRQLHRHEYRILTKDKLYLWMWFEGNVIRKGNKAESLLFYAHDISHLKSAEQDLAIREAQYRSLFENTTLGFYRTTPEGKVLIINPAAVKMLGFKRLEEVKISNLERDFFQPDYDRKWFIDTLNEKGFIKGLEAQWTRVDGKKIWIRENARLITKDTGEKCFEGTLEDISGQIEMEINLERQKKLLDLSQQIARMGSWEENLQTGEVRWSEAEYALFEVPLHSPVNEALFLSCIHADDRDRLKKRRTDAIRKKKYPLQSEYRLSVNGKTKWIQSILKVNMDQQGNVRSLFGVDRDITEEKERQFRLEEEKEEKVALLIAIPDMIFVLNKEGVYIDYINGSNIEPLVPPEQFLGKKITEVLPADVASKHLGLLHMAFATGKMQQSEYQLEIDNTVHFYEARISKINEDKALVLVRDVSLIERNKAELIRINQELKLFSEAIKQSPLSLIITDAEANIEYVNRYFTEVTGYKKEEVLGQNPRMFQSGYHDRAFYRQLWKTIRSGKTWRGEFLNKRKNGELYWESASISSIFNEQNQITHFIEIKEDITQKRQDAESAARLAALVENSESLIIGKTPEGIIESWNKGAELTYGYLAEEVLGKNISIIIPENLKEELFLFTKRIKDGQRIDRLETKRICKGGTVVDVSLNLSGIRDSKGKLTGIVVVGHDITRQKKLEHDLVAAKEQAEEATRSKSLFLANMSHEIRTPLNAILGFSEILSKRISNPVDKEYVQSMNLSGKALLSLINDLLDFSKMEAGKLELHLQPVDIRFLVHDIESIFRVKAANKQLDLQVHIHPEVPDNLWLDNLKLKQILMNLVSNAIKFTQKGFIHLAVRTHKESDKQYELLLEVKDSGKGIPAEFHQKIFQQFEQQDKSISNDFGGTGLGLAISQQLVSLMGGQIELESEAEKGSVFRVRIPGVESSKEAPLVNAESLVDEEEIHFEPASLLIVDDTENNRKVLKAFFEEEPFKLIEAKNGKEAIDQLVTHRIDLVLMDIRMPVMDGIKAAKIIREHPEWSHIPVIALTASTSELDEVEIGSQKSGFNDWLRKPVTRKELFRSLSRFLTFHVIEEKAMLAEMDLSAIQPESALALAIMQKVVPLFEGLKKIQPRQKVRAFAQSLIDLGKTYHSLPLEEFGDHLLLASENFMLETEKELLKKFSKFVVRLKNQHHESD